MISSFITQFWKEIIAVLGGLGLFGYTYIKGRVQGKEAVQAKYEKAELETNKKIIKDEVVRESTLNEIKNIYDLARKRRRS